MISDPGDKSWGSSIRGSVGILSLAQGLRLTCIKAVCCFIIFF